MESKKIENWLTKRRTCDLIMGLILLVYYFFPWISYNGTNETILIYVLRVIKEKDPLQVYMTTFLTYMNYAVDRIPDLAVTVFIVGITVSLAQLLLLVYLIFSFSGKILRFLHPIAWILVFAPLSVMVDFGGSTYFRENVIAVPFSLYGYLFGFLILYVVWFLAAELTERWDDAVKAAIIAEEKRKQLEQRQQESLENYVRSLEKMVDEMRAFRHDYKNILATMAGYLHEDRVEELKMYFREKMQLPEFESENQVIAWNQLERVRSMELKGFLYEKLLIILAKKIAVEVWIPEEIAEGVPETEDLVRILGIFLDNAVEETTGQEAGQIRIQIEKTDMGILFEIANTYTSRPDLTRMGQKGYTTKGQGRGNGLYWAGEMLRRRENIFHELRLEEGWLIQRVEVTGSDPNPGNCEIP